MCQVILGGVSILLENYFFKFLFSSYLIEGSHLINTYLPLFNSSNPFSLIKPKNLQVAEVSF